MSRRADGITSTVAVWPDLGDERIRFLSILGKRAPARIKINRRPIVGQLKSELPVKAVGTSVYVEKLSAFVEDLGYPRFRIPKQ